VVDQRFDPAEALKTPCFTRVKPRLSCRHGSHLTTPHAGAGGARSGAISDRMSANICRDTATSAIWHDVTAAADALRTDLDQLLAQQPCFQRDVPASGRRVRIARLVPSIQSWALEGFPAPPVKSYGRPPR
jgi:hypothetical protein